MKSFLLFFLSISTFLTANAQNFTDAVEYNDFIVEQQSKVGEKIVSFIALFNEEDMTKEGITPSLEDLLSTAKSSVAAIKQLTPFEGETQLQQAALELFQFYVQIIGQDYQEMVNLVFDSDMDDVAIARLDTLLEKIQAEEALYDGNFTTAQTAFAEKYNIYLEENELQDKLKKG